jgi:hypothetical protein
VAAAIVPEQAPPVIHVDGPVVNVAAQKAPVVHVDVPVGPTPVVNVTTPAPIVNVDGPVVNVPKPKPVN